MWRRRIFRSCNPTIFSTFETHFSNRLPTPIPRFHGGAGGRRRTLSSHEASRPVVLPPATAARCDLYLDCRGEEEDPTAHKDDLGDLGEDDDDNDDDDPCVDGEIAGGVSSPPAHHLDDEMLQRAGTVVAALSGFKADPPAAKRRLEECGVAFSPELVPEVLSRLRNDWSAAYTFFLWAGKQPGYSHSLREYHSMLSILAKMGRFDTAWALVGEMKRGPSPPIVTPRTLLILIRRYAAVHDVARAIGTFYSHKRYGLRVGIEEFHGLLCALCRYKNVEDAEHLLLCNENSFPLETKSFNIVLNGWCNVVVCLREAKRFWKDMGNRGIEKDAVSYGCMISCFSKAGSLNVVLKLFDRMKEERIAPDRKVYNAVIYALAKGKCVEEAKGLMKAMEEKGIAPNAATFNSLIRPLAVARRYEDARSLLDELFRRGIRPCIRTYHSFIDVSRTAEEALELLSRMKETRCSPVMDTYLILIRKLSRWKRQDVVFELWDEMRANGLSPDRSAYIVLIHGLFLNGRLEDAARYYEEMKGKGFEPEPKTESMMQAWRSGKEIVEQSSLVESVTGRFAVVEDPSRKKAGGIGTRTCRRPHFL